MPSLWFALGLVLGFVAVVDATTVFCSVGAGDGSSLSLQRIDLDTGKLSLVKDWTKLGGGLSGHTLLHYPHYPHLSLITLNTTTLQNYLFQTTELGQVVYTVNSQTPFLSQEISKSGQLFVISTFNGKKGIGQVDMKAGTVTPKMTFTSTSQPTYITPGISAYDPAQNKMFTIIGLQHYTFVEVTLSPPYSAVYHPFNLEILALEVVNSTTLVAASSTSTATQIVAITLNPFSTKVLASIDPNLSESSGASLFLNNVFYVQVEDDDGNKPALFSYDFTTGKTKYTPLSDNVISLTSKLSNKNHF